MTEELRIKVGILFMVGVVVAFWVSNRMASDALTVWIGLSVLPAAMLLRWVIWLVEKKRKRGSGSFWS